MLRAAFACWAAQRLFHRRRTFFVSTGRGGGASEVTYLGDIGKMIQKKANIARELLETERLYVQNLHILNDVCRDAAGTNSSRPQGDLVY